jgi:hypothetical protein
MTIDHSFKTNRKKIEITTEALREFFEDKELVRRGFIGDNFRIFLQSDTSISFRIPIYFREIDAGEIVTMEITKNGAMEIKSVEKYFGFVAD